jgi:drug/metabolite transporter (DMT)-like permease
VVSVAEVQLAAGLIVIAATIFVVLDAKARGMNPVGWGIVAFLFTIVAVPLYLIMRKPAEGHLLGPTVGSWICTCGTSNEGGRCRRCGYLLPHAPVPERNSNARTGHWQYPTCKVCERGSLVQQKVFRMSGPVVAIGFFLLVPSVIGMLLCALALVQIVDQPDNASGSAAGIVIAIGIACFVSGLLGWLLVMRKRILQCPVCGAVVNAS